MTAVDTSTAPAPADEDQVNQRRSRRYARRRITPPFPPAAAEEPPTGLVEQPRVPHVVHLHLRRPGQRVALSVRRLRERRRRLPHTVHHCAADHRQAAVLSGDDCRPVHQPQFDQDVRAESAVPGWVHEHTRAVVKNDEHVFIGRASLLGASARVHDRFMWAEAFVGAITAGGTIIMCLQSGTNTLPVIEHGRAYGRQ